MLIEFLADAPHTRREGSKKVFQKGKQYVLADDYGQEFIDAKQAKKVTPLTEDEINRLKNKKKRA
jgi:hypothetical protein